MCLMCVSFPPSLSLSLSLSLYPVIIMCMHSVLIGGDAQYKLLTTAMDLRLIDRGYIFIPYDTLLYSLPYTNAEYPILNDDVKLRRAYDGVLTVTMDQGENSFFEAFKEAQTNNEVRTSTPAEQVSYRQCCRHQYI